MEKGKKSSTASKVSRSFGKTRIFTVSLQNEKNDIDSIIQKINHLVDLQLLRDFAYICHDKDVYVQSDAEPGENGKIRLPKGKKVGDRKEVHTHFLLRYKTPRTRGAACSSLGIDKSLVSMVQPVKSFKASYDYLTHSNQPEKHHYENSEITTNIKQKDTIELSTDSEIVDYYVGQIQNGKMSVTAAKRQMNPMLFEKNKILFRGARGTFLQGIIPPMRVSFYICGKGGTGKDSLAQMLGMLLAGCADVTADPIDYIMPVKPGVTLYEDYDGQPVLQWCDWRAEDFIKYLGPRGFFNVFDTHPKRTSENVKYSKTNLINKFNIITGVQDYKTFMRGLQEEDISQAYRRLPVILELTDDTLKMLADYGFFYAGLQYGQYEEVYKIDNFNARDFMAMPDKIVNETAKKMFSPIVETEAKVRQKETEKRITEASYNISGSKEFFGSGVPDSIIKISKSGVDIHEARQLEADNKSK